MKSKQKTPGMTEQSGKRDSAESKGERGEQAKRGRKLSEYGRQLEEKQKVKRLYGMLEKQFRRFFRIAAQRKGATGETLLESLERRLDNVVYRLKLATTRKQARQIIVHGHVMVNGKKAYSPSFLVSVNDVISFAPNVLEKKVFVENVVDKRLNIGIKVPEWLELDKSNRTGRVLRFPVRADVQTPIEEHLIVELYSK
jgi:small subunit ribosomal protein S4